MYLYICFNFFQVVLYLFILFYDFLLIYGKEHFWTVSRSYTEKHVYKHNLNFLEMTHTNFFSRI